MRIKFDKYWEEIHGMMGVAVILDPSTSDRVIAPHRGSLHEDTVEALMCNQNWLWATYHQRGAKPDYQTANDDSDSDTKSEVIDH
ncbi:hypothetical protein PIB30_103798, partial [Stylosanthes scabra]|nr:hypothetical protein [Stylosanthes scabra]